MLADAVDGPVDRRLQRLEAALCEVKASGVISTVISTVDVELSIELPGGHFITHHQDLHI